MKTIVVPLSSKKRYRLYLKVKDGLRFQIGEGMEYSAFDKLIIEEVREDIRGEV